MGHDDRPLAVYWDFENVVLSQFDFVHGPHSWRQANTGGHPDDDLDEMLATAHVDVAAIVDFVATLGPLSVHRAYGDWSRRWLNRYDRDMLRHSVDLVQMFPARGTKNGADIRMAIDVVRDLQAHPHVTDVVLIAGDSDFISLAQHCRREGRRVTGIGVRRSVSPALVSACDVFKYVDTLSAKRAVATSPRRASTREIRVPLAMRQVVRDAMVQLSTQAADGWVRRVLIKPLILRLDPAFDEAETGARTFTDFLASMGDVLEERQTDADREYRLRESSAASDVALAREGEPSGEQGAESGKEQAREALRLILTAGAVVGRDLHAPQVHAALQMALPSFDFRSLGHPTFSAFIEGQSDIALLIRHEDGYPVCRLADGAAAEVPTRFEAALHVSPTRISDIISGYLLGIDPLAAAYAATLRLSSINLPSDRDLMWRLVRSLPTLLVSPEQLSTRGQVAAQLEAALSSSSATPKDNDAVAILSEGERRRLFSALGGLATSSGLLRSLQASVDGDTAVTPEDAARTVADLMARLVTRAVAKEGVGQVEAEPFVAAMAGDGASEELTSMLLGALRSAEAQANAVDS